MNQTLIERSRIVAELNKQQTLAEIAKLRLSAILRTKKENVARSAMRAVVDGGFRMIEFTLTTPGAMKLIAEFAENPELLVGAGTVLTTEEAKQAVAAGARFIVSPVFDEAVVQQANELGAVSIPGTFTPTEMWAAHRAGADILKLFPLPGMGPEYIESVLGPLPQLRIFPTCGVRPSNFIEFLKAGAFGVGFTKHLFEQDDMEIKAYEDIRLRATRILRELEKHNLPPRTLG
jgi:Entner-Doudoroff aldolase